MLRRYSAFVLTIALLTACGGGGGSAGSTEDESGSSTTNSIEESESGGEESLMDFFGGGDDPEAAQAQYMDQESQRQELIRACMAEEGFDYTPVTPPEESFQAFGPDDEEDYVREQGFGITTWYGNEDQFSGPEFEWEDPNQEMVEAMSESEQEAYYEALYGSEEDQMEGATTETDPETGEEYTVVPGFGAGCEGEASEEVYGDPAETEALWEELNPAMEELQERIQADPRVVEFNEEWSECMAEAGFDFEDQQQMYETIFEDFQQRFDEIVGPGGGFADPFEGWTEEEIQAFFEENTQDEIDAFMEQAQSEAQTDVDQEALEALQQEEIDLAVANFECGSDFSDLYQEVSADYEGEFIEEHRELLEQIRDAQGG